MSHKRKSPEEQIVTLLKAMNPERAAMMLTTLNAYFAPSEPKPERKAKPKKHEGRTIGAGAAATQ